MTALRLSRSLPTPARTNHGRTFERVPPDPNGRAGNLPRVARRDARQT